MREIKFRAWDGERMRCVAKLPGLPFKAKHDGMVYMQFTGLKDSKGVDIYEGDVVRYNTGEVWVVKWSMRLSVFIYENKVNKKLNSWEQATDMREVEIIGNICENSHLVELLA